MGAKFEKSIPEEEVPPESNQQTANGSYGTFNQHIEQGFSQSAEQKNQQPYERPNGVENASTSTSTDVTTATPQAKFEKNMPDLVRTSESINQDEDFIRNHATESLGYQFPPHFPPHYSDTGNDIESAIQRLKDSASSGECTLPITGLPTTSTGWDIVKSFFSAITSKSDEIVALPIENNLITANTKNGHGVTPLLAAVGVGRNVRMVQELLDFGAEVDGWGVPPHTQDNGPSRWCSCKADKYAERTPLQLAATLGNLTLVKLFIEVYHANDALIAKDGQMALRLAAENGHREIADYLPLRRGGGWRRWKTQHATAMRRTKKAGKKIYGFFKILLYRVPKFLVWTLPKESGKCFWRNRKRFLNWCWRVIRAIPGAVKEILLWLARIPIGIPKATVVVAKFIWMVIKNIGNSIVHVGQATFSFLHSLVGAIVSFLRDVTLKDLLNGLITIFKIPLKLWELLKSFLEGTLRFMEALFGAVGTCISYLFYGLLYVAMYVPKKLWDIVASMGGLIGKAFKEVLVLINPRMQ
jgi:ankyrin repeat protein